MGERSYEKKIEYPWQIPIAGRWEASKLSETERRRRDCEWFFDHNKWLVEEDPRCGLVYDAVTDVFRFPDGRFALSREYADWAGLKAVGYFSAWGL